MFNNVDKSVAITGDSDEARNLENQMSSSWIAFAKTGDPNNNHLPHWPAYGIENRATMLFDVAPGIKHDPKKRVREILSQ